MSLQDLEKIPYFAVLGFLVIINMLLVSSTPDFANTAAPVYLTQAMLYGALGWVFLRGYMDRGFNVFLMAGIWLLVNIALWSNMASAVTLWLLFMVQLALLFMFATGREIKFAGTGSQAWAYAAVWLIFLFGLGKLWTAVAAGLTLAQISLWGLGVALVSFGYVVKPVQKEWAVPLQVIGCLISAVAALTLTQPGLQLVQYIFPLKMVV